MAAWIKMSLGEELGLGPDDFVLDGDPAPLPKKGAEPPNFRPTFYSVKTAGWIKTILGVAVGLSPGDFVLDGTQPPPKNGA